VGEGDLDPSDDFAGVHEVLFAEAAVGRTKCVYGDFNVL
jgi:hypothetical protein